MERKRSTRRGYPRGRHHKPLGEKIKDFLRHFVAFMFSNVGIIGLVVGYTIVGAIIFKEIEGNNPVVQSKREDAGRLLNATAERLWNVTCCGVIPLEERVWREEVAQVVRAYQNELVKTMKAAGSDSAKSTDNWSFSGAFLYSLTVITTIGYGNVTPRSEWGKITTVLYAIVGMPLFLLYLSNIGDILAKSFKWTYAKLWLCRGCPGARRRRMLRALQQHGQHAMSASKYNLKRLPPVVVDFGDDHSWTPGAHPASLGSSSGGRGRRRLGMGPMMGGLAGIHLGRSLHDDHPAGSAAAAPRPRGRRRRGRARHQPARQVHDQEEEEEEDEEEDTWRRPDPVAPRVRKYGVDHGRRDRGPYEVDVEDWAGAAPARNTRPRPLRSEAARQTADLETGHRAAGLEPSAARRARDRHRRGRRRAARREHDEDSSEDSDEDEEETPSTEEDLGEEEEEEEVEEEEEEEEEDEDEDDEDDVDDGEVADDDTDDESSAVSSGSYDPQTVTVPVTLCLAIMVGYVCGGAMLFSEWEDWNMLDGSYFCFISLSTIGFGDIVPGGTVYSDNIEVSFIICSMYLMLGMALIAMCFNLMQEEVIHKMRSCVRTARYMTRCNRRRVAAAS